MDYLLLLLGFAALIKSSDFLVDGASSLARRYGMSDYVVGLTVVAFATSLMAGLPTDALTGSCSSAIT